jgi:hypothetical protein
MPFPAKTSNVSCLLMKTESTYGTFATPAAATDAQLLALSDRYPGLVKKSYLYGGESGPAPGNTAGLPRYGKVGPYFEAEFPMRAKGFGAAYSASNKPNIHSMLLISGMDGTGSFVAASEKYTYTITSDASVASSGSYEYYHQGQKYAAAGVLASMSYEIRAGGPPLFKFATKGIQNSDVVDTSIVSPTYPTLSVLEPVSFGGTFTIGAFLVAVVRSANFEGGRSLDTARPNLNGASAHMGFVSTEWKPKFTVSLERTSFVGSPYHTTAGIDYYKLAEAATQISCLLQVGSTQYNRFKHTFAQSQLADVSEGNDGGVATVDLTFEPVSTTPGITYDWSSFLFD